MAAQRVIITAGGTGGHLYPAQALAQQLAKLKVPAEVLFIAGGLASTRHFDRKRFAYREIASSPLLSRNPLKTLKGGVNLFRGFAQSVRHLKNFRPDVVVGFGSYYTIPILLAARWLKIPIVLHEANSIPGRANQWLAPFADYVGVNFPYTASFFKGKTKVVGLPLREGFQLEAVTKAEALTYFGLSDKKKTLLICGGSQGARSINKLIENCMQAIKKLGLQCIHLTGNPMEAEVLSSLYASRGISSCVKPFESRMQMAWRAADAFVGRSGASTIVESIEFEVPGILIPYPHATDRHQDKNAEFLVNEIRSGKMYLEPNLDPETLGRAIEELFRDKDHNDSLQAIKAYKKRPHQLTLCELVSNL